MSSSQPMVFVTGGTGFIGRHLVEGLLARGYRVRALTRRPRVSFNHPRLEWVFGSLEDVGALQHALNGCPYVIHLAGLIQARRSIEYFHVNAEGTARLVEAVVARGMPRRLIYISSLAAVGPARDDAVDETTPPHPITPYGESKLAGEQWVTRASDAVTWTIIRPSAVYGPGDRAFLRVFRWAARGWQVFVGSPDFQFSLIYVKDLVDGILTVLEHPRTHREIYFIADPKPYTQRTLMETLIRVLAVSRSRRVVVPSWLLWTVAVLSEGIGTLTGRAAFLNRDRARELMQSRWVCQTEKLATHTGFRPQRTLEGGLRETVAWYREHGWL